MLSMKTLFLLIVSSLSRVSSVARLGPDLLVYKVRINKYFIPYLFFLFKDHVIINLTTLEKQSRPGNIRGYLRIQSFTDDDCLCPMAALVEYDKRVSVYWPISLHIYNISFYRFLYSRLIDLLILFHSKNLTMSSLPRPCLVGFALYYQHLEWIQVSFSPMLPDQQLVCCSASQCRVSSYASWQIGH